MKNRIVFIRSGWMTALNRIMAVVVSLGMALPAFAQPPLPVPPSEPVASEAAPEVVRPPRGSNPEKELQLNFRDSPLDQVLDLVADLVGRTIIKAPGVNATITLKSQTRLKVSESMAAIEAVLAMNNITLVPMGDKFLKVVQTAQARQEAMPINLGTPVSGFGETDKLISQVFTLKYMELAEIQPIIQGILHGYGKIQPLERANSLMVTDTEGNLARITEILEFIDQPVESLIETRIYEVRFAKASEISGKLNELIADSQAKEEKPQINVSEAQPGVPTPPGVIRARQAAAQPAAGGGEVEAAMQMAERGMIRGKVKIIADDRTNILFVISRSENFGFFDKIVGVLDRPVDPAITVRVVALEYAKAEEISGILNEFIGAAAADKQEGGAAKASDVGGEAPTDNRSQALRDFIRTRAEQRTATAADATQSADKEAAIGRLSPDTKILADKRTNSLLMMGRLQDLMILEDLIDNLDIMLAQVVIEAVIIEVTLSDELRSGVDWLQRSMVAYNESSAGPGGGVTVSDPVFAWGGGTSLGAGTTRDASTVSSQSAVPSGGMNWYLTMFDLNIDAVIRLSQSTRDAQILSTPVIVTTDNTEAKIIASTQRPVVTTTSTTDGGSIRSSYEYRDIGINLTVTPRINPQRMVVMEVNQTADDVAGEVLIDGNLVPEITKRELNATIAVGDRSTIVLGGLILNQNRKSETKIPLLGDIPVLGNLFKFKSTQQQRGELIVLLTPYVLMTPAEARAESTRLYSSTHARQRDWTVGWSDSEMSRMGEKQKAEYIKNWEKNRPEPYLRELSVDPLKESDDKQKGKKPRTKSSAPQASAPEPAPEAVAVEEADTAVATAEKTEEAPPAKPEKATLLGKKKKAKAPEPEVVPVDPAPAPVTEVAQEAEAGASAPIDYSKPLPVR